MLNRRTLISLIGISQIGISQPGTRLIAALPAVLALPVGLARPAWASSEADRASAFIKSMGDKLVAAINANGSLEQRRQALTGIIDAAVDVDGVARFCLGRFWRTATPAQQQQYLSLFRNMLVVNISSKIGDYRGVRFTLGATQDRDAGEIVSTVVERPNNPPANIQWVVANAAADPKVVDVIAEGTSLRVTQRDDYAAFLSRNGNNVDALLGAIRQQVSQNG
jgi:phospholipid transport system substrate-binding protein